MIRALLSTAAVTLTLGGAVQAATITNGSFEAATFTGGFTTLGTGDPGLTGWTIDSGSVDLINTYWNASEGSYSIDMSGDGPSMISTLVTGLNIGYRYLITFDMAANTDGDPQVKLLDAVIGTFGQQYSVLIAGNPVTWTPFSLEFVASAASHTLTFSSAANGDGPYGPALDNVQIATVPVPTAGLMLLAGLAGLAGLRRRKTLV